MPDDGKNFTPIDLTKVPAYESMKIGDPWTFIMPAPFMIEMDQTEVKTTRSAEVGDLISKWFDTSESGRIFRITAIHGSTYETVFEGFEP